MTKVIKKTLYPKTKRVGVDKNEVVITEKLDGSNLGIFKGSEGLIIAQRNNVFYYNDKDNTNLDKGNSYKGLLPWLEEHGKHLIDNMYEGSGLFGEWIGMGKIKYGERFPLKFYAFAKANLDLEKFEAHNLYYDHDLFKYPFTNQEIPWFVGVVPVVHEGDTYPSLDELDIMYDEYLAWANSVVPNQSVEGFIVNQKNVITKYVRHKNGQLTEHKVRFD